MSDTNIDHQDLLAAQGAFEDDENGFTTLTDWEYQAWLDDREGEYWDRRAEQLEEDGEPF